MSRIPKETIFQGVVDITIAKLYDNELSANKKNGEDTAEYIKCIYNALKEVAGDLADLPKAD